MGSWLRSDGISYFPVSSLDTWSLYAHFIRLIYWEAANICDNTAIASQSRAVSQLQDLLHNYTWELIYILQS